MRKLFKCVCISSASAMSLMMARSAQAELLINPDFETDVQTTTGNHFPLTPTGWSIVNAVGNIVNDPGNGQGGSNQYLDLTTVTGTPFYARQSFTIPSDGTVNFSAYFSSRDGSTGDAGVVSIYDSSDTNSLATGSAATTDVFPTWTPSSGSVFLTAGTYTFRSTYDDAANTDSASVTFTAASTPEPASVGLLCVGGLMGLSRRRRRA